MTKFCLAIVSFGLLWKMTSWQFALLAMMTIGFHEHGHLWAMRKCGLKTGGFFFIPLLGGMAIMKEKPRNNLQEVVIDLMGPFWGLLLAAAVAGLHFSTGRPYWAIVALWMAAINLFNLLPICPLDGGRFFVTMASVIHDRWGILLRGLCLFFLLFLLLWTQQLVFLLLAFLVYQELRSALHPPLPPRQRIAQHLVSILESFQAGAEKPVEECDESKVREIFDSRGKVMLNFAFGKVFALPSEPEIVVTAVLNPDPEPEPATPMSFREVQWCLYGYLSIVLGFLGLVYSLIHSLGEFPAFQRVFAP